MKVTTVNQNTISVSGICNQCNQSGCWLSFITHGSDNHGFNVIKDIHWICECELDKFIENNKTKDLA